MKDTIRLAVISDIHCHIKNRKALDGKEIGDVSFLTTSTARFPPKQNPVQSILDLIKERKLTADFVLAPGDFADKIDESGFRHAWTEVVEIAEALGVSKDKVISTIGNHDVNSREAGKEDVFRFARNMHPLFPFASSAEKAKFWDNGYAILNFSELDFCVLVINSSHHHYSLPEARQGKFDDRSLALLEEDMKKYGGVKYKLAMSHHHPIPHEEKNGGATDKMIGGDVLLTFLEKNSFKYFVHGHKHDPRIAYSNHGPDALMVFAAGSFSRHAYSDLSGMLNTFHILNLETTTKINCNHQGTIETFTYAPSFGFDHKDNLYFPATAGFGCSLPIEKLAEMLSSYLKTESPAFDTGTAKAFEWYKVLAKFPEISYMSPLTFENFGKYCYDKYQIKFKHQLPERPEMIHLLK